MSFRDSYSSPGGGDRNRRGGGGGNYNGGGDRNRRGGGGRNNSNRNVVDTSQMPFEQGIICSLQESFGFIHCAERPEEIFFHYSQVKNVHPDDLQIDTEVEFFIGPSQSRGGGDDGSKKLAAFQVQPIPTGTVIWEIEEAENTFFDGTIDKPVREGRSQYGRGRGGGNNSGPTEGTIQVIVADAASGVVDVKKEQESASGGDGAAAASGQNPPSSPKKKQGPLIRYRMADFSSSNNNNNNNRNEQRLCRGDVVRFRIWTDRRTKQRYAKSMTLIQTEREKSRIEREERSLLTATQEQGIIVTLNNGFGFLQSNKRRDHIYFHYSHLILPDSSNNEEEGNNDNDSEFDLKVGQEMKFLVVVEEDDSDDRGGGDNRGSRRNNDRKSHHNRKKFSARQLKCLPKGSVVFHTVIQKGVQGIVATAPRPPLASGKQGGGFGGSRSSSNTNFAAGDGMDGTIRLQQPINLPTPEAEAASSTQKAVEEVSLRFTDAPGGVYSFVQRSGAAVNGLWIREGDVLLFDVVQDTIDDACRAVPTLYTLGMGGSIVEPSTNSEPSGSTEKPQVRLVSTSLTTRAEGQLQSMKQGGYGFIQYAERNINIHFQTYNILPEELQIDLRKQFGIMPSEKGTTSSLSLEEGVGMQFDLSSLGNFTSMPKKRGGGMRGRSPPRSNTADRENIKAQRILLLPSDAVCLEKVLATNAQGVISSADKRQEYAGFIDAANNAVVPMKPEEIHPLVAKMISSFIEESVLEHGRKTLVYKDVLSSKEDEVVVEMVKYMDHDGVLSVDHIPVAGMDKHAGRLIIKRQSLKASAEEEKASAGEEPATHEEGDVDLKEGEAHTIANEKKKTPKDPNKNIRFDKASLTAESKENIPPGKGDTVAFDVVESRRTRRIFVRNLRVVERVERSDEDGEGDVVGPGVGVVKEVMTKGNFGFISLLDENSSQREVLFFTLTDGKDGNVKFGKGDEVKFDIVEEKNGKRVAKRIEVAAKGTIRSKPSRRAARGIVLMEPVRTTLKDNPARRKKQSNGGEGAISSRWKLDGEDKAGGPEKSEIVGHGYILLIEDNFGLFNQDNSRKRTRSGSVDSYDSVDSVASFDTADTDDGDDLDGSLLSHLKYKNGSIAIHGVGASSTLDSTSNPKRGDIVTFVKARKGRGLRDMRVETRKAANLVRGHLENIDHGKSGGNMKFMAAVENETSFNVPVSEVISCNVSLLTKKQAVEGILHEGSMYGICRTTDLYLESKLGAATKERPKLNLTVRKTRGGTIMAQSMMAKGPDGTPGFLQGWTERTSEYVGSSDPVSEEPHTDTMT